uniref:Adrenomedullin 2 n=1 Tax=Cairina moschata TaxID=8855 RepID=A0A8C3B3D1_CAIMO
MAVPSCAWHRAGGAGRCRGLRLGCRGSAGAAVCRQCRCVHGGLPDTGPGCPQPHVVWPHTLPHVPVGQGAGVGQGLVPMGLGQQMCEHRGLGGKGSDATQSPLVPRGCAVPGARPQARAAAHWSWPQGAGREGPGCPCLAPRHGHRRGAPLAPRHPVARRGRRHAGGRLHHAQLLRVGCVLGTCQVQNLSHRLWQLMGQSGRQDSSPMNPNSPHSYG